MDKHKSEQPARSLLRAGGRTSDRRAEKVVRLARVVELVKSGTPFFDAMKAVGYRRKTAAGVLSRARCGAAAYAQLLALGDALPRALSRSEVGRMTGATVRARAEARVDRVVALVESGTPIRDALVAAGYQSNRLSQLMSEVRSGRSSRLARLSPLLAQPLSPQEVARLAASATVDRAKAKVRRVVERVKAGETYVDAMLAEGYSRYGAADVRRRARKGAETYAQLLELGPALTMRRGSKPSRPFAAQPSLFASAPKLPAAPAAPAANDVAALDDETVAALELLLAL